MGFGLGFGLEVVATLRCTVRHMMSSTLTLTLTLALTYLALHRAPYDVVHCTRRDAVVYVHRARLGLGFGVRSKGWG